MTAPSRSLAILAITAGAAAPAAHAQLSVGPDALFADVPNTINFGVVGSTQAYALGSATCNIGDADLPFGPVAGGSPVLATNAFMFADGVLRHVGMSWCAPSNAALATPGCGFSCSPAGVNALGSGCQSSSSPSFNGIQGNMIPRSGVDPSSGGIGPAAGGAGDPIFRRLQIDLATLATPGATFFVEGAHVSPDDIAAGNQHNNNSYREVNVSPGANNLSPAGPTTQGLPAIYAWQDMNPSVQIVEVDVPGEGRFIVGSNVTPDGPDFRYDYAVYNLNSDVACGSFSVPVPPGALVHSTTFSDAEYHSGEIYDNTDWLDILPGSEVIWATPNDFATDPNSSAIRWATMATFSFTTPEPPAPTGTLATLGLFKPFSQPDVQAAVIGPDAGTGTGTAGAGPENPIDGLLPPIPELNTPLAIQDTPTGFGDSNLGLPDFANGSETNAAYARLTPEGLELVITGNLESNFNKFELFFDTIPGGQNKLRGDNADIDFNGLNRMGDDGSGNGLTFDLGFDADFYITVTGGDVGGGLYNFFVAYASLPTNGGGIGQFLGAGPHPDFPGSLFGGDNPEGLLCAIDNSSTGGVDGANVNDPLAVPTGIEMLIPMHMLGHPQGDIRMCAFINGAGHDFVSNQVLGGVGGQPNPGEPRNVNFDAIPGDQFFELDITDFDGDGVPDGLDNFPHHFNPSQSPTAPTGQVIIDQVDRLDPDGSPVQLNSGTGVVGVVHDAPDGESVYVNVEIDGLWAIKNMPVFAEEDGGAALTRPLAWTGIRLGPDGANVASADVRSTATSVPLTAFEPTAILSTIPVGDREMLRGSEGPFQTAQPGDADDEADFEVPDDLPRNENTHSRYGFNVIDLDSADESSSCSPSSVAASFAWLNRTYKLGLDDTKDQLLDEFERRMETDNGGTDYDKIIPAKKQFVVKNKLPITIEGEGRGSPGAGEGGVPSDVDPDNLFEQIKLGQDVELSYRWGGDDDDNRGHALAVIGMSKDDTGYIIQTGDDAQQSVASDESRTRTGRIYMPEGSTDWYIRFSDGAERRIVGWRAESPTYNQILDAICKCIIAMQDAADELGDGNGNDTTEARQLIDKYYALIRLTKIAIKNAECKDEFNGDIQTLKDLLTEIRAVGRGKLTRLPNSIANDTPEDVEANFQALRDALNNLKATFNNAFETRLTNDTDRDGIPNDDDNAPNSANPEQEDCNNDGIGDVDQLGNENDRNDNAIPDDCEEACEADWNLDGNFNDQDWFDFVNAYFDDVVGNADFNHDGFENDQDFFDFVNAFFACQNAE